MCLVFLITGFCCHRDLTKQTLNGLTGGLIATVGLEVVRHIGFLLGGMPGEMPKLMGVLLVDRFALGPNAVSNLAGWGYHFWNGAAFGLIYSLLFGKGKVWLGTLYGVLIGIGLMVSPVVNSLGVGYFGVDFGWGFPATYDPANGILYFPHQVQVTEGNVHPMPPPKAMTFTVTNSGSELADQISFLWATLNFTNMMDPNNSSSPAHLAYHHVFDGDPFPTQDFQVAFTIMS